MESLPQIVDTLLGSETIPSVNARGLHEALGVRRDFTTWIKQYTSPKKEESRDWFENKDFGILLTAKGEQDWGGSNRTDYALSIEMAEHIAMMTRTKKGREVRNYFRKARDERNRLLASGPRVPVVQDAKLQMIIDMAVRQDEIEQRQLVIEAQAREAQEKANLAIQAQTWITIRQFVAIHSLTRQLPPGTQQQQYGRWLAGYCSDKGLPVYKQVSIEGWNENTYPVWTIQETISAWLSMQIKQIEMKTKKKKRSC
jgi:phage anti-repressor protein